MTRTAPYARSYRTSQLLFGPALSFFLFSLLSPASLAVGEQGIGLKAADMAQRNRLRESAQVYSIIKSRVLDLSETTMRDLTIAIMDECRKHSLDPILVLAVMSVESEFRHKAISASGARGLMQIRPTVAGALAEEAGFEEWKGAESLDNPITNIKLGVFYLGYLKQRFKSLKIALAAYRWGPTKVQQRLEDNREVSFKYAHEVLAMARFYRDRTQPLPRYDSPSQSPPAVERS